MSDIIFFPFWDCPGLYGTFGHLDILWITTSYKRPKDWLKPWNVLDLKVCPLRSLYRNDLLVPRSRMSTSQQCAFASAGPLLWNCLPVKTRAQWQKLGSTFLFVKVMNDSVFTLWTLLIRENLVESLSIRLDGMKCKYHSNHSNHARNSI